MLYCIAHDIRTFHDQSKPKSTIAIIDAINRSISLVRVTLTWVWECRQQKEVRKSYEKLWLIRMTPYGEFKLRTTFVTRAAIQRPFVCNQSRETFVTSHGIRRRRRFLVIFFDFTGGCTIAREGCQLVMCVAFLLTSYLLLKIAKFIDT